jgi:hypothetical protein
MVHENSNQQKCRTIESVKEHSCHETVIEAGFISSCKKGLIKLLVKFNELHCKKKTE